MKTSDTQDNFTKTFDTQDNFTKTSDTLRTTSRGSLVGQCTLCTCWPQAQEQKRPKNRHETVLRSHKSLHKSYIIKIRCRIAETDNNTLAGLLSVYLLIHGMNCTLALSLSRAARATAKVSRSVLCGERNSQSVSF